MISVVCVYNNDNILNNVLLKSLKNQSVDFELMPIDNRNGIYKSAAEALNHGGAGAKGDYIMFVHQDMWLASDTWLEDVENMLRTLPALGVAGVAGMSENGRNWSERIRYSAGILDGEVVANAMHVERPQEVQTLDECLLIAPRAVFDRLKFDQNVFTGWDCYGADYCLSARRLGLKVYVIPAPSSHSCLRSSYHLWELKGLLESQRKLHLKHRHTYKHIYMWVGDVSWPSLTWHAFMGLLGPVYIGLFPNRFVILKKGLAGCHTVLDLGCGPLSPISRCDVPFSVGVELFDPSLQESRRKSIHSEYVRADVRRLGFKPKSFDAVIAVEVLEHLTKEEGIALLSNMEQWARKKVLITTPNGYIWQDCYDSNPSQQHKSGWSVKELGELGFKVRGIGGWKHLRGYKGKTKYHPDFLWGRISDVTQKVTYCFPKLAFGLLAVKHINKPK